MAASMSYRMGVLRLLALPLALTWAATASAQPTDSADSAASADEGEEEEEEADKAETTAQAEASASAVTTGEASTTPAAGDGVVNARSEDHMELPNGFVRPRSEALLEWHGGLEADLGYASYTFERDVKSQAFYDMRGRFVVGPTLDYRFGANKQWFLAARGELVGWLREYNDYQINTDDVYGQFGLKGVFDVKVGRFQTWRVYHKGAGWDLYTLEDQGACRVANGAGGTCSLESGGGAFGPHTYEVNHIYYREPAGRIALHAHPTPWSGVELTAAVGNNGSANTLGGRAAGMVQFSFLRVSAAGEYRSAKPSQAKAFTDPNTGQQVDCPNCAVSNALGFGGGVELTLKPVGVGLNFAQSHETQYTVTNGTLDQDATNQRTSLGGYAEVDVGSLAFERALILGFGLNRTEVVDDIQNFEQHYQAAAYALFPLGFNAASIKLVVSQATLDIESSQGMGVFTSLPQSTMRAARLRLAYPF